MEAAAIRESGATPALEKSPGRRWRESAVERLLAATLNLADFAFVQRRSGMTLPEPEHLDSRQRDTLRQIFQHPASHNIDWRAVLSLLEAVGTVTVRHDGKVAVTIGPEREFLEPPAGKDIDAPIVADLRQMLSKAGYGPS